MVAWKKSNILRFYAISLQNKHFQKILGANMCQREGRSDIAVHNNKSASTWNIERNTKLKKIEKQQGIICKILSGWVHWDKND